LPDLFVSENSRQSAPLRHTSAKLGIPHDIDICLYDGCIVVLL